MQNKLFLRNPPFILISILALFKIKPKITISSSFIDILTLIPWRSIILILMKWNPVLSLQMESKWKNNNCSFCYIKKSSFYCDAEIYIYSLWIFMVIVRSFFLRRHGKCMIAYYFSSGNWLSFYLRVKVFPSDSKTNKCLK